MESVTIIWVWVEKRISESNSGGKFDVAPGLLPVWTQTEQNRTEQNRSRAEANPNRTEAGTGEGQRAPCREAQREAQRGPERPREAQRWSREPRELTEPKQSIDFTGVFAYLKPGPELPSHRVLKKHSPLTI